MLKVSFSHQAFKCLQKVSTKHGQQIERTLRALKENPIPHDAKHLKGVQHYLRVDVGEYRIIYRIDNSAQILIIAMIGKRNDGEVYKKFKRVQM